MSGPDIVARLRAATGQAHQRLDERLDIIARLSDHSSRRTLVARFWGLHAGAEPALAPALGSVAGLDLVHRSRMAAFAADLAALDLDETALERCPVDAPAEPGEALGFLYVLEGSSLGGKVIRRAMAARGRDLTGLGFLDPYGARTGERWCDLLTVLRRESEGETAGSGDAIVRGGITGFARAEAWLCDAPGET